MAHRCAAADWVGRAAPNWEAPAHSAVAASLTSQPPATRTAQQQQSVEDATRLCFRAAKGSRGPAGAPPDPRRCLGPHASPEQAATPRCDPTLPPAASTELDTQKLPPSLRIAAGSLRGVELTSGAISSSSGSTATTTNGLGSCRGGGSGLVEAGMRRACPAALAAARAAMPSARPKMWAAVRVCSRSE